MTSQVTSPAPLDPLQTPLPNPYQRSASIAGWVALASIPLVVISIFWVSGSASRSPSGAGTMLIPGIIGLIVGGISLIGAPIAYISLRSESRRINAVREGLRRGEYLVRWRYDPEEWAVFRQFIMGTRWATRWDLIILGFFIVAVPIGAMLIMRDSTDSDRSAGWIAVLCLEGFLVLCIIGAELTRRAWHRRLAGATMTLISTLGFYANGHWLVWGTATRTLAGVVILGETDGTPLRMVFSLSQGEAVVTEEVMVPRGQRNIAERIIASIMNSPASKEGGGLAEASGWLRTLGALLRMFR